MVSQLSNLYNKLHEENTKPNPDLETIKKVKCDIILLTNEFGKNLANNIKTLTPKQNYSCVDLLGLLSTNITMPTQTETHTKTDFLTRPYSEEEVLKKDRTYEYSNGMYVAFFDGQIYAIPAFPGIEEVLQKISFSESENISSTPYTDEDKAPGFMERQASFAISKKCAKILTNEGLILPIPNEIDFSKNPFQPALPLQHNHEEDITFGS